VPYDGDHGFRPAQRAADPAERGTGAISEPVCAAEQPVIEDKPQVGGAAPNRHPGPCEALLQVGQRGAIGRTIGPGRCPLGLDLCEPALQLGGAPCLGGRIIPQVSDCAVGGLGDARVDAGPIA
jgi:hypothetical protein